MTKIRMDDIPAVAFCNGTVGFHDGSRRLLAYIGRYDVNLSF
ncbi:hypothetical protein [Clostridium sp. C105KSO13]|nr:hypothetical protein [Clostridium sp. C105KSO13]